jgi:hypothetical protein
MDRFASRSSFLSWRDRAYFSEVLIEVNLVLSLVPSPFTTAMIASEMPRRLIHT